MDKAVVVEQRALNKLVRDAFLAGLVCGGLLSAGGLIWALDVLRFA